MTRAFPFAASMAGLLLACACPAMDEAGNSPDTSPIVLTNASQIRCLTPAEAARSLPVRLSGVMIVLGADAAPSRSMIFADRTAGIYVRAAQNITFHLGDLLEVTGVTDPGQFAPIVVAQTMRKLGTAALPPAQPVSYQQLITGGLDAQWVEIKGVVRRCYSPTNGSEIGRIVVAVDGGVVPVRYKPQADAPIQVDTEVLVHAVCFYQFNQKRQALHPVLQAPREVPVQVAKPAPVDPFGAPVRSAASLLMFAPDNMYAYTHRVHVRGIVTCSEPDPSVWIRDGFSGLRIQAREHPDLSPGDEIEALGFPTFGSTSPLLEDAEIRKSGSAKPPVPLVLTNLTEAFDHEDDLVAVEGALTHIQPVLDGLAFTLEREGKSFRAVLNLPQQVKTAHPEWETGSQVRVAGICSIPHDETRPYAGIWQPQSFQILLRSPDDLAVVRPPDWWTLKHVAESLVVVIGFLVLVISLVVTGSWRRLREQRHQRALAETEFAGILSERNRLAREIHDTLAQGLAATSVQLRLAKKKLNGASEAVTHHIDAAQLLVRGSLAEARNSIWNMRAQVLENGDLSSALDGILKQMADGKEIATTFDVSGRPRRLAPVIENNVLRIGQEAIANSASHSAARTIKVNLEFGERQFRLRVADDGRGFDPQAPPRSEGGFGLMGMRERAAELKGELAIHSAPGQGAEVVLSIPLAGD